MVASSMRASEKMILCSLMTVPPYPDDTPIQLCSVIEYGLLFDPRTRLADNAFWASLRHIRSSVIRDMVETKRAGGRVHEHQTAALSSNNETGTHSGIRSPARARCHLESPPLHLTPGITLSTKLPVVDKRLQGSVLPRAEIIYQGASYDPTPSNSLRRLTRRIGEAKDTNSQTIPGEK